MKEARHHIVAQRFHDPEEKDVHPMDSDNPQRLLQLLYYLNAMCSRSIQFYSGGLIVEYCDG